mmetsp:Transcript_103211/g.328283  ORF Transcript_103211/g.328283 Transcript_103211/m.328283 type:complete len:218 (-) Transcript_103211:145-798(-)
MSSAMLRILVAALVSCASAWESPDQVEAVEGAECEAASLSLLQNGDGVLNAAALRPRASRLPEANGTAPAADAYGTGLLAEAFGSLEYELSMSAETVGEKNKIILVILELLGLGCCGIDRCYMGQTCVGVVKGLTLGGLIVWAFLDYIGVVVTCLSMNSSINYLGIRADFTQNSVTAAFVITIVVMFIQCCCIGLGARSLVTSSQPTMDGPEAGQAK